MRARLLAVTLAAASLACAGKRPPAAPEIPASVRLAQADDLVRAGCYDCLAEARTRFLALQSSPEVGAQAIDRAVKTAILIASREEDLGLVPGPALDDGRAEAQLNALGTGIEPYLTFAAAFLRRPPVNDRSLSGADLIARNGFYREEGARAAAALGELAGGDIYAASLWFGLACSPSAPNDLPGREHRDTIVAAWSETPLLAFKKASSCASPDRPALTALLEREPRFVELNLYLGLAALSGRERPGVEAGHPDVEGAETFFQRAYAWRPDWPSLTLMMGGAAEAVEDFARGFEFYDRTLMLRADDIAAYLGKIRMLTNLGRHQEAVAATDRMLALGLSPGDARYWRAYNELAMEQNDAAWDDIERASELLINGDVPKLAGIIAINRRDYAVARQRLELAIARRAAGCDPSYYLQAVLSQQREWNGVARATMGAVACLEREAGALTREIAAIDSGPLSAERKSAQIARRRSQIETDGRRRVTAIFNAAVASYNLARADEARAFAAQLTDDPQFGDRVREILNLLDARR